MLEKIGILFDLDGTLLDTLDDLTDAVNYTMRHFGCPERTRQQVRSFVGNGPLNLMEKALPGLADDPNPMDALRVYKPYYEAHSQLKTRPYSGIMEAMKQIQGKYPVAIVSNKQDSAVKALCSDLFAGVYAQGEVEDCPRKPAPDMLFQAAKAIGVERFLYIGDSEVDILTAKNAGVPCISVLWGFRDEPLLREFGGEYFCSDPTQLPVILEEIVHG